MKKTGIIRRISLYVIFAMIFTAIGGAAMTLYYDTAAVAESVETGTAGQMSVSEVTKLRRPSVVQVIVSQEGWDPGTRNVVTQVAGYGSGDYILKDEEGSGGYILTNYHVVEGGDSFQILWYNPETGNYDLYMDASLVGYDNGTDIAILKFDEAAPAGADVIPMGDSDALELGNTAIVIGHPGAASSSTTSSISLYGTVTAGVISGLQRSDINAGNFSRAISLIQVDAAINSGNSGGALLNDRGELVGIPTLKYAAAEGMGFCIPINSVKDYITEIIETGSVVRPRMGVSVQNFDGPDEPMKSYPPMGIMIMEVEKDSPAEEAGLLMYDVIAEVNGVRVTTYDEMTAEIDKFEAGDVIELKVYRYYDQNGNRLGAYEEIDVEVELKILDD